jgi:hypothetical protein|eukprot:evm.model.NODE_8908_length_28186_cov_23.573193.3
MLLMEVVGDANAQLFSIQGTNDSSTGRVAARSVVVAVAAAATGTTGGSAHDLLGAAAGVQTKKKKKSGRDVMRTSGRRRTRWRPDLVQCVSCSVADLVRG